MKIFSKILIIVSVLMSVALLRTATSAQSIAPVEAQIVKFNDYYRFSFKGSEYLPFDIIVDGDDLVIDFEKENNLDLSKYIYNNSIIKSFGSSGDGKSYIIKISSAAAGAKKFIADDNITGFDLYVSDKKVEKKIVMMSPPPEQQAEEATNITTEEVAAPEEAAADTDLASNAVTPNLSQYATSQIITFPRDFIGPPRAEQLLKNKDSFVGPLAYDPAIYSIYEVMKIASKGAIIPEISVDEDGFILSFSLTDVDNVSAAALAREDKINILFNSSNSIQLDEMLENPFIKSVRNVPDDKYRIVELTLNSKKLKKDNYGKAFYKDKFAWVLQLYKQEEGENKFDITPINLVAENNYGEKRIVASTSDVVGPAIINDEKTGQQIKAFMVKDSGTGVTLPREYVDVKFLPSLQGIFLTEKSDFLAYDPTDKKLFITKLSNLQISDDIIASDLGESTATLLAAAKIKGIYPEDSIFPFPFALHPESRVKKDTKEKNTTETAEKEEGAEEGAHKTTDHGEKAAEAGEEGQVLDFDAEKNAEEAELEQNIIEDAPEDELTKKDMSVTAVAFTQRIISAPKESQSDIKVEMAEMYFSKGFYAEALGVLQDIKITDPAYKDIFKVNVNIALCQYFTEKYSEAFDSFSDAIPSADKDKNLSELKLWQWASQYMYKLKTRNNNDSPVDIDFTAGYDKFMQQYPIDLRYKLGLMFIDQKMKAGKIDDANNTLEIISYSGVPKAYANDTLMVKAQLADKQGDFKFSTKVYEKLQKDIVDRKNRAKSIFELTKNKLLKNQITSKDAIDKFLEATTIWRDDYFEMDVLEIVGHLYIAQKDYFQALASWKQISTNFPETAESVFILGKMRQIFIDLFDGGTAYKMKPLDTLKLYFGFRELTPAGAVGDSITRKVALFFISADMMDESIKIVEHQIKYRSFGDEKAKLALWLYTINIDNRDLDGAESALNLIKEAETTPALIKEKKYDHAMIVALRGDYQSALDMIKNDFSSEADKIRTELFWQKENWFGVINMVEARLQEIRETKPLPLTKGEMNDVNRLLVAYSAQGENRKLVNIRNEFYNRIPNNDDQLLFDYLTAGSKVIDYNDFENSVELGQIERFLNDYTFMPTQSWDSSIKILEPKVAALVGKPIDEMSRQEKLDVVKLAIAYSMLSPKDDKEANDMKKAVALLARDFKDIRVDRFTIDAFNIFDDKYMPKENDAVFEGKVRITDIPEFVDYYKRVNKFSQLNMSIRDKFKN